MAMEPSSVPLLQLYLAGCYLWLEVLLQLYVVASLHLFLPGCYLWLEVPLQLYVFASFLTGVAQVWAK